ncbi:methyltransferase domain-containing protein, partial [Acinetobacter baumannii]
NIEVAKIHAETSELTIDYRATTAEAIADAGETFDVVLAMEIVEHVADVNLFLTECARMVKPGGLLFVATLNRTPKSFALAIVGAE